MSPRPDVLVAVPARDEAGGIARCLEHVIAAGRLAVEQGSIERLRVAVAAHRCSDATAEVAKRVLGAAEVEHVVIPLNHVDTVGEVRTALVIRAVAAGVPLASDRTWLFSTDADSCVPCDWITETLRIAARTGADLVAGMTELDGWEVNEAARRAYARLIAAGIRGVTHTHVYAANLAVRMRMFGAVGGFPAVEHGEEQHLVAAVRRLRGVTVSTLQPRVRTSARMPGRASHGLGALLAELADLDGAGCPREAEAGA